MTEDTDNLLWNTFSAVHDDDDAMQLPPWVGPLTALVPTAVAACLLGPMLMRRGAPFAPTTLMKQRIMLDKIAQHDPCSLSAPKSSSSSSNHRRILYDLGSGDGRLVLAAAQQAQRLGLDHCIGIEMNPVLHAIANVRRFLFQLRLSSLHRPSAGNNPATTQFLCQDLWQTSLQDASVVTLYAYPPMMTDLGVKLRRELPQGALVVSNQYPIPGWKPHVEDDHDVNTSSQQHPEIVFTYTMPPTILPSNDIDKDSNNPSAREEDNTSIRP